MLQFNELRIDSDKNLIVDVSVLDMVDDPNRLITIDHILIGVGSTTDTTDYIGYIGTPEENLYFTRVDKYNESIRGFRLVLPETTQDNYRNIMYAKVTVNPVIDVPCSYVDHIEGYTYDKCLIMDNIFDYLKKSENPCADVTDFTNYLVIVQGLELALEGGNFTLANTYWKKFFANNNMGVSSNNCGCR